MSLLLLWLGLVCAAPAPLRIQGVIAAVHTPFSAEGALNLSVVDRQAAWLNRTGVRWVFVAGTTGESMKLSVVERKALAEQWVTVAPKYGIKVIIHVGIDSIVEAVGLAQHAQAIGATAIGSMPSILFKSPNAVALAQYMSIIFNAAPNLPAYYYHFPEMTGVSFPALDLVKAFDSLGLSPNFAGIKYTGLYAAPGFMDVMKILNFKEGKYEVLGGRDELMVESMAAGVIGFVGSQYNLAGDLYNRIMQEFNAGTVAVARESQVDALELLSAWADNVSPGVDGCKNVLNVMDVLPIGESRPPSVPMSPADALSLKKAVVAACQRPGLAKTALCSKA
jgi:N-acetylneuraminate lyase